MSSWNDPGPTAVPEQNPVRISGPGTYRGTVMASRFVRLIAFAVDCVPIWAAAQASDAAIARIGGFLGNAVGDLLVLLILAWIGFDFVWLQATRGWSVGKRVLGLRIAQPVIVPDRGAVLVFMGIGNGVLYVVGRALDWVAFIGFIVGFFRGDRRTFAELLSGTIVLRASTTPVIEWKPASGYVRDSKYYE